MAAALKQVLIKTKSHRPQSFIDRPLCNGRANVIDVLAQGIGRKQTFQRYVFAIKRSDFVRIANLSVCGLYSSITRI